MATPTVFVQNQSTVLQDADVQKILPALQAQVDGDFAPIYLSACTLTFADKTQKLAGVQPTLVIADNSDQAGALGYHELSNEIPVGFVFAKDDIANGLSWTVTVSHELLELLHDPFIDLITLVEQQGGRFRGPSGVLLAREVCDACEADQFAYTIDGVQLSDFVMPEWFNGNARADGNYSFKGNCKAPQQILQGGYIGLRNVGRLGQWGQVTGQHFGTQAQSPAPNWVCLQHRHGELVPIVPPKGSRRERRGRFEAAEKTSALPAAIMGPVRGGLDHLIGQAEGSLAKVDNVTGWLAQGVAGIVQGKQKVRLGLEMNPVGASLWLEPKI